MHSSTFFRYVLNGFVATAVHYIFFNLFIYLNLFNYYATSNFLAAFIGIFSSFIGNRYFVFRRREHNLIRQYLTFLFMYTSILLIGSFAVLILSDFYKVNHQISFFAAALIQFFLSYYGNKFIIFRR